MGSHRSPEPAARASAALEPWTAHRGAAPNTGTSWRSYPGSIRKPAPARPLDEDKPSNRRINFQRKHPWPPSESMFGKGQPPKVAGFYSATPPQNAAVPWPTIAPPRTLVERFFDLLTGKQIRRGVHRSTDELEAAIRTYVDATNAEPKPFRWRKSADRRYQSLLQTHHLKTSESGH
jgi:hypothetical protein